MKTKSNQLEVCRENRLIHEKSPYLLQHAHNPVDWFPWGPEAFDKAKNENKPIFLSIGYSTCHWCHVMAEESFDDPQVAQLINDAFVPVKVDREERPDLDALYMNVCQIITGTGGWPLSLFLTPDRKPFFAATYIPKHSRSGNLGLIDLIPRIRRLWDEKHDELIQSADQITAMLRQESSIASGRDLNADSLDLAFHHFSETFDEQFAGFGNSMKFPTPHNFYFLLRYWNRTANPRALEMVERTLQAMRDGGIFDQLGGGFHRYATDRQWRVPHFEKMLYDQALIALACLETFQATGKKRYADTAREIFAYVLRDLTSTDGGFYCGQDADSEGEEGKFYLWTVDEIQKVLGKTKTDLAVKVWNIRPEGNYTDPATGQTTGRNILHQTQSLGEIAAELKLSENILRDHLEIIREKLLTARDQRPHPHTDDKILTDWNGLMIAALARVGRVLDDPHYTEVAKRACDFILTRLRRDDGKLLHRFRDREAAVPGLLNDYAFLAWGALELYQTTFEPGYLEWSTQLTGQMIGLFRDNTGGGFYMASESSPDLVVRPKDFYDGAIPAGNSVAALNLRCLARLTGKPHYEEQAAAAERAVADFVQKAPAAFTHLLLAVDFAIGPSFEVVIAGESQAPDTRELILTFNSKFLPNAVVLLRPTEIKSPPIVHLAEFTKDYHAQGGRAAAYVCRNFTCQEPTTKADEMLERLGR